MNKEDILKWSSQYNDYSYPPQVYMDFVVNQMDSPKRFEILGAWKGGCLRKDIKGSDYIDSNSESYSYTNRWAYNTPVSRLAWETLKEIADEVKEGLPEEFPMEAPIALKQLMQIKGFSFVLSTFILHTFYPKSYPLYDQHVYRSFKALSGNNKLPKMASKRWSDYYQYREFFNHLRTTSALPFWTIDRAIWAYGKQIKKENKGNPEIKGQPLKPATHWINCSTLGKSNPFQWRLSEHHDLEIKREPNSKIEVVTSQDIDALQEYLKGGDWFALSNNVEKLHQGAENEGIGWFLFNFCDYDPTQAQLSSHLGALFSDLGIWEWNSRKRGIKFRLITINWRDLVNMPYEKGKNAV